MHKSSCNYTGAKECAKCCLSLAKFLNVKLQNLIRYSTEANSSSANQEIPHILRKPTVDYHVHMKLPLVPTLARLIQSTASNLISLTYILILSSHLHLGLLKWCFSFSFPYQNPVCISLLPCAWHICHPFLFSPVRATYATHFSSPLCVPHMPPISLLPCVCHICHPFLFSPVHATYATHFSSPLCVPHMPPIS